METLIAILLISATAELAPDFPRAVDIVSPATINSELWEWVAAD